MTELRTLQRPQANLMDILDKVLDKGLVVAGDVRVSLANVELLTIKIRLLVCSIDKAQEIGLDWWRQDGFLSSHVQKQTEALAGRVMALEQQLSAFPQPAVALTTPKRASTAARQSTSRQRDKRRGKP